MICSLVVEHSTNRRFEVVRNSSCRWAGFVHLQINSGKLFFVLSRNTSPHRKKKSSLEVMDARDNGMRKGDMRVSVMCLVLTRAHYFQAPATQGRGGAWLHRRLGKSWL